MPEMQSQIDALREAFSADTSRPFELRPTFPHGSPGGMLGQNPPLDVKYPSLSRQTSHDIPYHVQQPMTPPVSAGLEDHRDRQIGGSPQSHIMVNGQQQTMPMTSESMSHDMNWNPKGIFQ